MENKKENYFRFYFISIGIFLFLFYGAWSSRMIPFDFENKVELTKKYSQVFDESYETTYFLSDLGILACISWYENSIHFIDIKNGNIIHSIPFDYEFRSISTTIINRDHLLYCIFDQTYIYVIDTNTFEIIDTFYNKETILTKKGKYYEYPVGFYSNFLLTHTFYGNSSVINIDNGKIISNKKIDRFREAGLSEDILYYTKEGFNVYVVNPITLKEIWNYDEGGDHCSADIEINSGKLYFRNYKNMTVFDAKTGGILDSFPFVASDYVMDNNLIYLYNRDSNVTCINIEDHSKVWEIDGNYTGVDLSKDSVFTYNSEDKNLLRVDKLTGELIWKIDWMDSGAYDFKEFDDFYIFESYRAGLYLVNKNTGEMLWSYKNQKKTGSIRWYVHNNDLVIFEGNELVVYDTSSIKNEVVHYLNSPNLTSVYSHEPVKTTDYGKAVNYQSYLSRAGYSN